MLRLLDEDSISPHGSRLNADSHHLFPLNLIQLLRHRALGYRLAQAVDFSSAGKTIHPVLPVSDLGAFDVLIYCLPL